MKVARKKIADFVARESLSHGFGKAQARELAAYLLEERRTTELASLLRDIQESWAAAGYAEVLVHAAHPLNRTTRQDVTLEVHRVYPHAERVTITEVGDASLVGGLRLDFAQAQLDLSVQSELNRFKALAVKGKD
ncbi:MAG TPA: F0F1 ATP synthase subunit delta [Candidatus Saccharimonadales bacterium]|nr:F0F1 ATP synthase subunit delta [Candidatus Saccharimonadales bacterium]